MEWRSRNMSNFFPPVSENLGFGNCHHRQPAMARLCHRPASLCNKCSASQVRIPSIFDSWFRSQTAASSWMSLEPIRVLLLFKLSFLNPYPGTPEAIMGYEMLWVTSMRAWGSFQLEVWQCCLRTVIPDYMPFNLNVNGWLGRQCCTPLHSSCLEGCFFF